MNKSRRFTAGQITVMVIAVCVAVTLAPVGVFAASHSKRTKVEIVDAKHSHRGATVTKSGAQEVTGSVKVSSGSVRVSSGTVTAVPGLPAKPFVKVVSYSASDPLATRKFTVPTSGRLEIVGISVADVETGSTTIAGALIAYKENGINASANVPLQRMISGSVSSLVGQQPVAFFPDRGTTVQVTVLDNDADPSNQSVTATFNGMTQ
jgi:hypothetical protein